MATIDKYFKPKEYHLPSPSGAILKVIPSSAIKLANQTVFKVIAEDEAKQSGLKPVCGEYHTFTNEE